MSSSVVPSMTSSRMMSHISSRLRGSSPVVGSSRNSTWGLPTRLAPRSSRRRMPPEYVLATSVRRLCEVEPLEDLLAAPLRLRSRDVVQATDHLEVLEPGEVLVDGGVLPGEADHVAELLGLLDDVVAGDGGTALVGVQERGQDPDGGGLAGPVGAEEAKHRARRDLQVHALQRLHLPEPLGEALDDDGWLGHKLCKVTDGVNRWNSSPRSSFPVPSPAVRAGRPPAGTRRTGRPRTRG